MLPKWKTVNDRPRWSLIVREKASLDVGQMGVKNWLTWPSGVTRCEGRVCGCVCIGAQRNAMQAGAPFGKLTGS
jgi:hypothetical protein